MIEIQIRMIMESHTDSLNLEVATYDFTLMFGEDLN